MLMIGRYGTRDLARAKVFYDAITEIIGAKRVTETPRLLGYRGAAGAMFIIGLPFEGEATAGNGTQLVLAVESPETLDALHAKALELGGTDEGAPGYRGPDGHQFYACYFRDLDGNKLSGLVPPSM